MRRVLVTGASGFIGAQALDPLISRGFEVHAISRRPQPSREGVEWRQADLLSAESRRAVIERVRPSHLLHFAWFAEHGRYWSAPENASWADATNALLREFADVGGRRAVLAGTCAEYDWAAGPVLSEADTPLRPATVYGREKDRARRSAEAAAARHGLSLAWGRIFFVFGPGEDPRRLTASVAQALLEGRPAECTAGEQRRDFMHTRDLGNAFAALLASGVTGPVNVASGRTVSVADLVHALARAAGRIDLVRLGARERSPGDPDAIEADVGRLRDEVGWQPELDLETAAKETIDWWAARVTSPRGAGTPPA